MKLSKLFHTLYATVMALPVLIIPIFALNILHKETEPISIEVQEKISVDFNQLVSYDNVNYNNYGVTVVRNANSFIIDGTSTNSANVTLNYRVIDIKLNHKYLIKGIESTDNYAFRFNVYGIYFNTETIWQSNSDTDTNIQLHFNSGFTFNNNVVIPQVYDLTQMYGEGNEPTVTEFNNTFSGIYYDYTLSEKMLVNKPTTTTFNSTDIGSQFVYALYKPVHDYFNFGDFFGLGGMYDWFTLNIFNGTAPLSFFIVFNVMIYWLFISLFWLLFDILIYVPMVIHKWLDKAEM